jgi:glutamine amidotransferase/cyclase
MEVLQAKGYDDALREYLKRDRPYLGICLGMQTLFESSEELPNSIVGAHDDNYDNGDVGSSCGATTESFPGLGVIPGKVIKFDDSCRSVPHIGWNSTIPHQTSPAMKYMISSSPTSTNATAAAPSSEKDEGEREAKTTNVEVYFVHSYYAPITSQNEPWVLTRTTYEGQEYISSVQRGNIVATQFHPEKSGKVGLNFIQGFLEVSLYRVRLGYRCAISSHDIYPRLKPLLFFHSRSKMALSPKQHPSP